MTATITLTNELQETLSFPTAASDQRHAMAEIREQLAAYPGHHAWDVTGFVVDEPITEGEQV